MLPAIGDSGSDSTCNDGSKLAGAMGLEPAASCVTVRRSNLGEAGCANVRENYRAKGVLFEETAAA